MAKKKNKKWYIIREKGTESWSTYKLTENEFKTIDTDNFEVKGPYDSLLKSWMASNESK